MTTHSAYPRTVGVVLAGGAAKRLGGGDKGMRDVAGKSLLSRATECLASQCDTVLLSANGDPSRFAGCGLDVIPDDLPGNPGPLAGILAALDRVALRADAEWLVSAPSDCPFLPNDLVERLHASRADMTVAVASSAGRLHPTIALWHVSLRADLYHALAGENVRKVGAFVARHPHAIAAWSATAIDPFFNVNAPEDLAEAERLAAAANSPETSNT